MIKKRRLVTGKVISQPTYFPSKEPVKNRTMFSIQADDKEYRCVVWGKMANWICLNVPIGSTIDAEGILTPRHLFIADVISITRTALVTEQVTATQKPGNIWTRLLAKLRCPGNCVSSPD